MNNKLKWIEPHQQYGFVALSTIPLRKEAKDSSEQTSQLLFGETVEILNYSTPWLKIRCLNDGYEGYVDHKQLLALTQKELRQWLDSALILSQPMQTIEGPMGLQLISGGSYVGAKGKFNIGPFHYQYHPHLDKIDAWQYALGFINTPYLWGGKSIFGIDCSGLVQNVFRLLDINLPRDAYQQADFGNEVDFEQKQPLDLAFFKNSQGRIHHVGIIGLDNQILHASGQVRIDTLLFDGIFNQSADLITHSLDHIRRYL